MGHEQTSYLHSLAKIFLSALLAAAAGNLAFGQEQATGEVAEHGLPVAGGSA